MTTQEILFYAAIVCFAIAVACIAIAVAIFFMRDIRGIRNYLTGKTMREAIERGSSSSNRGRRKAPKATTPSAAEPSSGPIRHVNTVTPEHSKQRKAAEAQASAKASGAKSSGPQVRSKAAGGDSQSQAQDERSRESAATTVLDDGSSATTILDDEASVTTMLEQEGQQPDTAELLETPVGQASRDDFTVVRKIVLTQAESIISPE